MTHVKFLTLHLALATPPLGYEPVPFLISASPLWIADDQALHAIIRERAYGTSGGSYYWYGYCYLLTSGRASCRYTSEADEGEHMKKGSHDVLKRLAWGCPVTLSLAYATEANTLKLRVVDSRNGSKVILSASQPLLYKLSRSITTEPAAQLREEVREGRPARALSEEDKLQEALRSIMIRKVLSTTTREEEAEEMSRQFSVLALHGLLFTKLDESGSLVCLFNLAVRSSLPLSYLTTGQRVPEDVEVATAEPIVDRFWHGCWGV